MDLDYDKDIQIDESALDVEWLKQPQIYLNYSRALAQARKELENQMIRVEYAVERIKTKRSKLILEAREEGGAKNAQQEEAYYRTHPDYLKAKKKWLQRKEVLGDKRGNVFDLEAAVFAFQQKKTALENLVKLLGQEYFAKPREPRDLAGEWTKHAKATKEERVAEKTKKKIRRRK